MTGEWDFVAIVRVPKQEKLAEVVTGQIGQLEGVTPHADDGRVRGLLRHDLEALFSVGATDRAAEQADRRAGASRDRGPRRVAEATRHGEARLDERDGATAGHGHGSTADRADEPGGRSRARPRPRARPTATGATPSEPNRVPATFIFTRPAPRRAVHRHHPALRPRGTDARIAGRAGPHARAERRWPHVHAPRAAPAAARRRASRASGRVATGSCPSAAARSDPDRGRPGGP